MKTGIITVGKRQVGWHSPDGIVRSFGADGGNDPPHVDELFNLFGQERGQHNTTDVRSRHGVRYLGELAYHYCTTHQDFSAVVLLLDQVVLDQCFSDADEPTEIILVGTNQPDTVAWQFRRDDTCWVTKLMAGAIRQRYPHILVTVWICDQPMNAVEKVRAWVQQYLQRYLKGLSPDTLAEGWSLYLQIKGSAPQLANAVELMAALIMRQYPVTHLIPEEPTPFFEPDTQTARSATTVRAVHLSEVLWSLEQQRIEMAWQRGNFIAAKLLLEPHRDRHEALYQLADRLAMATNWQITEMLKKIQGHQWITQSYTRRVVSKAQRQEWEQAIQKRCPPKAETRESKFLKIWELELLIELSLWQHNYTFAFMQFAQMLERLLFWRYEYENWTEQGYIDRPENNQWREPTLYPLWNAWASCHQRPEDDPWVKKLEDINRCRNGVVHRNRSITCEKLQEIAATSSDAPEDIYGGLLTFLETIAAPHPRPEIGVGRSLYRWGLEQLRQTTAGS